MTTKYDYLNGHHKAILRNSNQIGAEWGNGPRSGQKIDLANRAFEIYYRAINGIRDVKDPDHRSKMESKLVKAREKGWGSGVSDLEEAFEHYAYRNGYWGDENTKTYSGYNTSSFPHYVIGAPAAMANFLTEVDSGLEELKKVVKTFGKQAGQIRRAKKRDDWNTIGQALGHINTGAELAKPWLWTAPATQRMAGRVVSFTNVAGKIHSGATTYVQARTSGHFDEREAAALTAMQTAVSFLPVLGGFYGGAIAMIPELATWMQRVVDHRERRIQEAVRHIPGS